MTLDECLQAALDDARQLVEKGYWIRIQTYRASVLLDYGVIHAEMFESSLETKLYIAETAHASHS